MFSIWSLVPVDFPTTYYQSKYHFHDWEESITKYLEYRGYDVGRFQDGDVKRIVQITNNKTGESGTYYYPFNREK